MSDPQQTDPGRERWRETAGSWLRSSLGGLVLAAAVGSLVLAIVLLFPKPMGEIYVGGPQVYTRERLVNDRYDEDRWLHDKLDQLNDHPTLITGRERNERQVSVGAFYGSSAEGPPAQSDAESTTAAQPAAPNSTTDSDALPFSMGFLIQASIRDTIRELILENSLDDRHDLSGNSLYGLKFDTSVIPAVGRGAALVGVTVDLGSMGQLQSARDKMIKYSSRNSGPNNRSSFIPEYLADFYKDFYTNSSFCAEHTHSEQVSSENPRSEHKDSLYCQLAEMSAAWQRDLQHRLENYENRLVGPRNSVCGCKAPCSQEEGRKAAKRLGSDTVSAVLGEHIDLMDAVPSNNPYVQNTKNTEPAPDMFPVNLPSTLGKMINIAAYGNYERVAGGVCLKPMIFSISLVSDTVYEISEGPPSKKNRNNPLRDLTRGFERFPNSNFYVREDPAGRASTLQTKFVSDIAGYLRASKFGPYSDDFPRGSTKAFIVPTGLISFLASAAKQDEYAYALSPRTELAGFLIDNLTSVTAAGALPSGRAKLVIGHALQQAKAVPRSTTFVRSHGTTIQFGWDISGDASNQSSQKSNLALVSVPAWIGNLHLLVCHAWRSVGLRAKFDFRPARDDDIFPDIRLVESGEESVPKNCEFMDVPVPPDFEALDSLLVNPSVRLPPEIFDHLVDFDTPLIACHQAEIVIPGERLWRSTVVTLGNQAADQITVLPNMRGIVAEFEELSAVPAGGEPESRTLRVWTAEGSDETEKTFKVYSPYTIWKEGLTEQGPKSELDASDRRRGVQVDDPHRECLLEQGGILKEPAPQPAPNQPPVVAPLQSPSAQ